METWFILAIVSLIFSGLHIFGQKVGVARNYNSNLLNGFSSGIAGVITFIIAGFVEGYSEMSWIILGLALLSGVIYLFNSNLRMDSLRYIDTTIALPIHKFISPLFALLIGAVVFKEHLTTSEWAGILFGVLVPLLLINRVENNRQENLKRGLILIIISAFLSGIGAAIYKLGANLFSAVLLFAGITNILLATASLVLHKNNKSKSNTVEAKPLDSNFFKLAFIIGLVQMTAFTTLMMSFSHNGPLAVVYTITSLYIVIPIVLSIIFYNEHWNTRKVVAIVLSILAVGLMG